ncbi:MAG: 50S ribosomal protein L20 [Candidatus Latescibacterota bacterium]|nr:MAG: 50S ribosomal protein L20 [Candidatus Latescibacterota bacterium]
MPRATNNVAARARHHKVLKQAKGYRGGKSRLYKTAKEAVERSLQYAFRDRRARKRDFRRLWIIRINAAARQHGLSYSTLMSGLRQSQVEINRKVLAEMAVNDAEGFQKLVETAKQAKS